MNPFNLNGKKPYKSQKLYDVEGQYERDYMMTLLVILPKKDPIHLICEKGQKAAVAHLETLVPDTASNPDVNIDDNDIKWQEFKQVARQILNYFLILHEDPVLLGLLLKIKDTAMLRLFFRRTGKRHIRSSDSFSYREIRPQRGQIYQNEIGVINLLEEVANDFGIELIKPYLTAIKGKPIH